MSQCATARRKHMVMGRHTELLQKLRVPRGRRVCTCAKCGWAVAVWNHRVTCGTRCLAAGSSTCEATLELRRRLRRATTTCHKTQGT